MFEGGRMLDTLLKIEGVWNKSLANNDIEGILQRNWLMTRLHHFMDALDESLNRICTFPER